MQRIGFVAVLLLLMTTVATAGTCIGREGAVAYYNGEDYLLITRMMINGAMSGVNHEVLTDTIMEKIRGMVKAGRAVHVDGTEISIIEMTDTLVIGYLPNGRKVCIFIDQLRCK